MALLQNKMVLGFEMLSNALIGSLIYLSHPVDEFMFILLQYSTRYKWLKNACDQQRKRSLDN